eukprot:1161659-Pelagomonas_calceolata.AAC.25
MNHCPAFIADLYGPLIGFSLGYPLNSTASSPVPHCAPLTIPLNITEVSAGTHCLSAVKTQRKSMFACYTKAWYHSDRGACVVASQSTGTRGHTGRESLYPIHWHRQTLHALHAPLSIYIGLQRVPGSAQQAKTRP